MPTPETARGALKVAVVRHGPFYSDPRVVKETVSLIDDGDSDVIVLCRGQTSTPWFSRRALRVISFGSPPSEGPLRLAGEALLFIGWVALRTWRAKPQVVIVHSIPSWMLLLLMPLRWAGRTQALLLDHHEPEAEMLKEAGFSQSLVDCYQQVESLALRAADGVIDVSGRMSERSRRLGAKRQLVVDNCPQVFIPNDDHLPKRWDLVVFGSLIARYDLSTLEEALTKIGKPLSLLQIGTGDLALSSNPSGGRFLHLGYLDPPRLQHKLLECRFGFVGLAPSEFTNLVSPNRLWELVALGIPPIVARTQITEGLLGEAGIFYEGGSAVSLAEAISRSLSLSPEEMAAIAREARARLADHQWDREAGGFVRFITESVTSLQPEGHPA